MSARGRDELHGGRQAVEKIVGQLIMLSRSEEACRLLGVDGALVDHADVTLLDDPLDYVAYDIAVAIHDMGDEMAPSPAALLSTLVAELRLSSLIAGHVDQYDLVERVMRHLRELGG